MTRRLRWFPARRRALARLRLLLVAALLVPTLGMVLAGWLHYQRAYTDAEQRLFPAARIAQERALELFDTNQMLQQRMLDLVDERSDAEIIADGAGAHRRLTAMVAPLPQVQGLFIPGADARMLGSSRVYPVMREIDYGDRSF